MLLNGIIKIIFICYVGTVIVVVVYNLLDLILLKLKRVDKHFQKDSKEI